MFVNVDYASGKQLNYWMDSLSASFAGLQVKGKEGAYTDSIAIHRINPFPRRNALLE